MTDLATASEAFIAIRGVFCVFTFCIFTSHPSLLSRALDILLRRCRILCSTEDQRRPPFQCLVESLVLDTRSNKRDNPCTWAHPELGVWFANLQLEIASLTLAGLWLLRRVVLAILVSLSNFLNLLESHSNHLSVSLTHTSMEPLAHRTLKRIDAHVSRGLSEGSKHYCTDRG